jgi:hypothetical protein
MSDDALLMVCFGTFAVLGSLIAWRIGRLVESWWPPAGTPCVLALGIGGLFLSWVAAVEVTGTSPAGCEQVFSEPTDLDAELLARCVATAGETEISSASVLRRYPDLHPFSLRRPFLGH